MKIYVASSWKNRVQPHVVKMLRAFGHEVYDFKNPGAVKCKECDGGGTILSEAGDVRLVCESCRGNGYVGGNAGFGWAQLGLGPDSEWDRITYLDALATTRAQEGFKSDMDALRDCDACVLVQPCGNSAHL